MYRFPNRRAIRLPQDGTPGVLGLIEENGRASHDAHLSDDEAVAKMGHPRLWWTLGFGGASPTHDDETVMYGAPGLGALPPMSQKRDMGHPRLWWTLGFGGASPTHDDETVMYGAPGLVVGSMIRDR
jgi:hypothetical protein